MNNPTKEDIEKFLDEFMLIEYRGKNHIIALMQLIRLQENPFRQQHNLLYNKED
jgi:hypothetical protein